MVDSSHGAADHPPLDRTNSEGVVEKTCKYLSALALMVLLVVVGIDVITRWGFNFSYEVSDEVAAYMLVAIAFLSLPVSHINGAFHRVEFFSLPQVCGIGYNIRPILLLKPLQTHRRVQPARICQNYLFNSHF